MSGYTFLIMSQYCENIKSKFESLEENSLKANIKKNKLVFFMMLMIIFFWITAMILSCLNKNTGIIITFYIVGAVCVLFLIKVIDIMEQKNYIRNTNKHAIKLTTLRKILIEQGLYEKNKIDYLIKECSEYADYYRFSNKLYNSAKNIIKTIFIPIIAFAIGVAANTKKFELQDIVLFTVITLLIVFLGLLFVFEIKLILESFLDSRSSKMKNLKNLLIDINLKDFV